MISFNNNVPIYLQIMDFIELQILKDVYKTDELVPSTNKLAEFLSVNQTTINRSIRELTEKGVLYKKRGIGMFVSKDAKQLLVESHNEHFKKLALKEFIEKAINLNISKEELIKMIEEEM